MMKWLHQKQQLSGCTKITWRVCFKMHIAALSVSHIESNFLNVNFQNQHFKKITLSRPSYLWSNRHILTHAFWRAESKSWDSGKPLTVENGSGFTNPRFFGSIMNRNWQEANRQPRQDLLGINVQGDSTAGRDSANVFLRGAKQLHWEVSWFCSPHDTLICT